ncbi:DUF943 family protein [[Erwinia] mediterraneensis]|uniref:DUF943 family protein n=1 Tax=[Erwinia] mediterraneensis TaxID=2161819 RepID=UPI00103264AC|nr:DUF943 family protein [[Erwinia] mediterraneensis]
MKYLRYLLLLGIMLMAAHFCYSIWQDFEPVEIVAVHKDDVSSDVLVKNFPVTDRGKLDWWQKNHAWLKEKYGVPEFAQDGSFSVWFWNFGDGYKALPTHDLRLSRQTSDLLCFDEMKTKKNCIEKDAVLRVASFDKNITFLLFEGSYIQRPNGKIEIREWK